MTSTVGRCGATGRTLSQLHLDYQEYGAHYAERFKGFNGERGGAMARDANPNEALASVISESGWTYDALAHAVRRVAAENNDPVASNKSNVSHWVRYGVQPSGNVGTYLAEALSRRLERTVTLGEIGLPEPSRDLLDWRTDTLSALADLRRIDVDLDRRQALRAAVYSVAALAVPAAPWWARMAERGISRSTGSGRRVGRGDVAAVRDMAELFSRMDQRHGGGHARTAVVQYLTSEVAAYLQGSFADDRVRWAMYSTASELAYLAGWMAFDNSEHALAQRYFTEAVRLAAEGDDGPMAAHVL